MSARYIQYVKKKRFSTAIIYAKYPKNVSINHIKVDSMEGKITSKHLQIILVKLGKPFWVLMISQPILENFFSGILNLIIFVHFFTIPKFYCTYIFAVYGDVEVDDSASNQRQYAEQDLNLQAHIVLGPYER